MCKIEGCKNIGQGRGKCSDCRNPRRNPICGKHDVRKHIPKKIIEKLRKEKNCYYCDVMLVRGWRGKKNNPDMLTIDHKIPVSKGGESTEGNLVASCNKCNQDKSDN